MPFWHDKRNHRVVLNCLYGRGFSCTATVNENDLIYEDWKRISSKLDDFDNLVACSSSNQGFDALPSEVKASFTQRNDIIWIDGNDINADHSVPKCASTVFRREMD